MSERPVTVEITDTKTGVTRSYRDTWTGEPNVEDDEEHGLSTYMWSDGNWGCDCNRSSFFAWAAGEERDPIEAVCGDDRYLVRITDDSGAVMYEDDALAEGSPEAAQVER